MISIYFFREPVYWILPWVLQTIAYFFILKKMSLKKWTAIVPFLAEREFSTVLFRRMRSFYRPFVVAAILAIAAYYLDPMVGLGRVYMWIAFIVYGIFLLRLYWRLGKAMGKGKLFRILLLMFPLIFLFVLGLGRSRYEPLPLKPLPQHGRISTFIRKAGLVLISTAEILAIILVVGFITIRDNPPEPLVGYLIKDTYEKTKDLTGTGEVIDREKAMGDAAASIPKMEVSREHFFPNHTNDQNVVVLTYIVGSNLEDRTGLATMNIDQMIDSTKQGDALTYVMEAGASERWFTKGIDDRSVGRYIVKSGELTKVQDLPSDTCMTEKKELSDFLRWAGKNYPADRYILVLWDHGGGVPYGYGQDELNEKPVEDGDLDTMRVSEVVDAVKQSGIKFDIIGFDACLMQDIEIATAFEPYADYYLASEENEGGNGWFYTSAFGKLAKDPGTSSEDFAKELIACYDPYNTITMGEGELPIPESTLSFVDLTLAAPAYDRFCDLLESSTKAVKNDPVSFADMAGAASSAYAFGSNVQIDLIGFLKILDKMDYDGVIGSHKEKVDLIRALQASVLYRNGAAAKGIYGLSVALPYKSIYVYGDTSNELKLMSKTTEKKAFDTIFSIMAAQQKKDLDKKKKELDENPSLHALVETLEYSDFTKEPWYIKGFEDYDSTKAYVDIPLVESADGYKIQLPEKAWKIINDCQTIAYQKVEGKVKGAETRYLGTDHIGSDDVDGHPVIAMDENWVHIGGKLVCYEAEPIRRTDEGDVFTGKVKARLNEKKTITLKIEWNAVEKGSDAPAEGRVVGYDSDSLLDSILDSKGNKNLEAGDRIEFLFDYYDKEGNLIATRPEGGQLVVTKQSRLKVTDEPLGECDIVFGGVLTDIYQRVMTTEQLEMHLSQ